MSQPIAAQVSLPNPQQGQSDRSSFDFQFLAVPAGTNNISVNVSPNLNPPILFSIMQDVAEGGDPVIYQNLSNGGSFSASLVSTGNNYYLASPNHASSNNFTVTFSGDV